VICVTIACKRSRSSAALTSVSLCGFAFIDYAARKQGSQSDRELLLDNMPTILKILAHLLASDFADFGLFFVLFATYA
jgi:hypothetical protein